jgi:hypothetical protein
MFGQAVYCPCGNLPNCKICLGRGVFYVPHNINISLAIEGIKSETKPISYEERFLMSDETILPNCFKVWISDKKVEPIKLELLSILESDESILLRTKFTTVDSAIKTAHKEIENRIEIWYAYDRLKNKKYYTEIEVMGFESRVMIGWFDKNESGNLNLLQTLIKFFKKEFMIDNL